MDDKWYKACQRESRRLREAQARLNHFERRHRELLAWLKRHHPEVFASALRAGAAFEETQNVTGDE